VDYFMILQENLRDGTEFNDLILRIDSLWTEIRTPGHPRHEREAPKTPSRRLIVIHYQR
jgi:hypothetical protein